MKKYLKPVVTYVFYAIAALMVIYAIWQVSAVCKEINEYYAQIEGMSGKFSEYFSYSLQNGLQPLMWALMLFGIGYDVNETRKLNPAYYKSEEEIAQIKKAKEAAKKAKNRPDYESMTKAELYSLAKENGLKVTTKTTKGDLIAALDE